MQLAEDIINKQKELPDGENMNDPKFSHMMHGQGCWDIDKTYWINFHQTKNIVTELSQIKKVVDFLK